MSSVTKIFSNNQKSGIVETVWRGVGLLYKKVASMYTKPIKISQSWLYIGIDENTDMEIRVGHLYLNCKDRSE